MAVGEADELVEVDVCDDGEDHAVGGVVADEEGAEEVGGEGFDVFLGAEDVVCERVSGEEEFLELVVDEVGRLVAVAVDFLDDDVFLVFDFVERELRVEEDVAEKFDATREVLDERGGVDAGFLLGGEGVEFAADAVDAVEDVIGAAVGGAFEDGVLDEMSDALLGALLVAGADVDIDARVGDGGVGVAEDYPEAVGEGMVEVHCLSFKL